jgi:hypothetical protein
MDLYNQVKNMVWDNQLLLNWFKLENVNADLNLKQQPTFKVISSIKTKQTATIHVIKSIGYEW